MLKAIYSVFVCVAALLGCASSGLASSGSPCLNAESANKVIKTEALVIKAVDLTISAPYDALRGAEYACVLLEFQIDSAGKAENPIVVHSMPRWALERAAFRALRDYLFSTDGSIRSGMLLFEYEIPVTEE